MRKNILVIAALLIALVSLSGCEAIGGLVTKITGASLGDPAGDKTLREGAIMEYVSNTSESLTVKMENRTDSTWQSGNMRDYTLEAEKDGVWYTVTQVGELANTMELMLFAPGDEMTHTFKFSDRYGRLEAGKYRVVKSFWANASETIEAGEFHLVCEFTVE